MTAPPAGSDQPEHGNSVAYGNPVEHGNPVGHRGPARDPVEQGDPVGQELPSLRAGIEAILLVVDEPVPEVSLAQILERPRGEVAVTLRELAAEYTEQGRGFELREIAGGWRYYTRDTCAPVVERFVTEGQQTRLTQAALETLAVVAYRQPVSRARVSAIRGVNSDGVIRTLTLRGLIEEAGQDPETQAHLYRTTRYFLERLGLRDLDELPDLAPYLPDDVEGLEDGPGPWSGERTRQTTTGNEIKRETGDEGD
ncbi:MAG TPA: SMC-Scp complex subunit ScpB [Streptosporangiaceae bacterium]